VAAAQLDEAKAGRYPFLQFEETYTHSNNPVFVFGSLLEQGRFTENNFELNSLNNPASLNNFRHRLNLKIPVFNRFQIDSGINQARIRGEQVDVQATWVEQQIRFQVVQAYYGVLVSEERRKVAEEALAAVEAELASIQSRYDQGMMVKSDLLAMQVQVADFRQQLVQAEGDVRTARAALNTVLAVPIETDQSIAGQLEEREFTVPPQATLIRQALSGRPDYQQSEMEIDVRGEQLRSAKGKWWPDLNLFAGYGYSAHDFVNGSGDFAVGANLTFDIVDLGRSARIQQAVAATAAARAEEQQKANQISFEVVEACQAFLSSEERLRVASAAVDQAVEALRIVGNRSGVGLTTVTEVLRAQTAMLQARLNLLGARYDYTVGFAKTLLVTGQLNDVASLTR
jgi:outer membrane protein TolC